MSEAIDPQGQPEYEVNPLRKKTREESRRSKIDKIKERDGLICYLCEKPLDDSQTIDHIIPKSKGGSSQIGNLALTHEKCNSKKADHLPEELELPFKWDEISEDL